MNNEDVTQAELGYEVKASHMEGDIKVLDDVKVLYMNVDADPSYGDVIKQIVETQGQERNVTEIWQSDDANYMPKDAYHFIARTLHTLENGQEQRIVL